MPTLWIFLMVGLDLFLGPAFAQEKNVNELGGGEAQIEASKDRNITIRDTQIIIQRQTGIAVNVCGVGAGGSHQAQSATVNCRASVKSRVHSEIVQ